MRKSITKRIRITKTGKLLRQAMGQGHFLAKRSNRQIKRRKHLRGLNFGTTIVRKFS